VKTRTLLIASVAVALVILAAATVWLIRLLT
jgi:hypothetical protein